MPPQSPAEQRHEIAEFIQGLYTYYVRIPHQRDLAAITRPNLPTPPITISTILVEECHAVASMLARAVQNQCTCLVLSYLKPDVLLTDL